MFNDQTLNGQWSDGAADGGNQPQQPVLIKPPQQPVPMPEAQHIQVLLEVVAAIRAGQQSFMDNQARYGLALESMTHHLDNLGQATAQGSAQAPMQHLRASTIKTRDLCMFNGCVSEVVSFLWEICAYIDLQQVPTNCQKAMLLSMYLKDGSPISWFNVIECASAYLLDDWAQLQEAFTACFQDPNLVKSSLTAIENLKQTGSAADYANKFQEHLVHLYWSMFTQITYFDCGLKPSLKLVLVNTPRPAMLDEWISTVVKADNRLHEYECEQKALEKKPGKQGSVARAHASLAVATQTMLYTAVPAVASLGSSLGVVPMEIDAMRCGPVTAEEKEHCHKDGLCFYCSQGKHLARDCPNMSEQKKKALVARASPVQGKA